MIFELPLDVKAYKRTTTFTAGSVPKGLLSRHSTKKNTWGLIVVETGSLQYTIFDEHNTTIVLTPDCPGVIEPEVYHKVTLLTQDTTFYVEFYGKDVENVHLPKFISNEHLGNAPSSANPKTLDASSLIVDEND